MKLRKIALLGSIAALFAASAFASPKPIAAFAEGEETSVSVPAEEISSAEEAVSEEAPAEPNQEEPIIPDDKWASFETKVKEIIAKVAAVAGSIGASLFVVFKIVTWLGDRGLIKKNKESAETLKATATQVSDIAKSLQENSDEILKQAREQVNEMVSDGKMVVEATKDEIKNELELYKAEVADLKNVIAIMLKMDPAMVSAGAYKQAMPYLGVKEDGAEK